MTDDNIFAPPTEEELKSVETTESDIFAPPSEMELQSLDSDASRKPAEGVPSQTEALLRGGAQGLTFDFADEIAGAAMAGKETLFGDEELSDLINTYKEQRDIQRADFDRAEKEHGGTFLAGEIAGGILPALATGGSSLIASGGKTAAKLGAKEALKHLAKKQTFKELAKTGAKVGAVQGAAYELGQSKELSEDTLGEMTKGAAFGGILGGTLPAAASGTGKLLSMLPGTKAAKLGYKAGQKGIRVDKDSIANAIKDKSREAIDELASKFDKIGLKRSDLVKEAEELGLKFNADTPVREMLEGIKNTVKTRQTTEAAKKYSTVTKSLEEMLGDSPKLKMGKKLNKAAMGTEGKRAVDAVKMNDKGFGLAKSFNINTTAKNMTGSKMPLKVKGVKDVYVNDSGKIKTKITAKSIPDDADNVSTMMELTPTQMKSKLDELSELADFGAMERTLANKKAGELYNTLNKMMDKGVSHTKGSYSKINKQFTDLYEAMGYAGVKKSPIHQADSKAFREQSLKFAKFLESSPTSQEKLNFYERLKSAGPDFKNLSDDLKFYDSLSDLHPDAGVSSVSAKGLIGSAESIAAKVASGFGKMSNSKVGKMLDSDKFRIASKLVASSTPAQLTKKLVSNNDITDLVKNFESKKDGLMIQSKMLQNSDSSDLSKLAKIAEDEGNEAFRTSLVKAASAEGQQREAQLSSLQQNPAFRAWYRKAIKN